MKARELARELLKNPDANVVVSVDMDVKEGMDGCRVFADLRGEVMRHHTGPARHDVVHELVLLCRLEEVNYCQSRHPLDGYVRKR